MTFAKETTPITRAQKLQREYKKESSTQRRVWDDIDQRWVVEGAPAADPKKEKGIAIDPSSAVGKSSDVQEAVHERFSNTKDAQANAIWELKEREAGKKKEDTCRRRLEPKLKARREEHDKKKQI